MDVGCYPVEICRGCSLTASRPASRPPFGGIPNSAPTFSPRLCSSSAIDTRPSPARRSANRGRAFTSSAREGRIDIEIPFNIPPHLPTRIHLIAGGNPPVAPNVTTLTFDPADQYGIQADAFAAAVFDGSPVPTAPTDAVANMRVIEAIFAAGREGR